MLVTILGTDSVLLRNRGIIAVELSVPRERGASYRYALQAQSTVYRYLRSLGGCTLYGR